MALPAILHHSHSPSHSHVHAFSHEDTHNRGHNHNHAYSYVNTSLLYPSTASHSHALNYSRDEKTTGLRVMTSCEGHDMGLRMDLPPLSKTISPSLSVRTFVTAIEVMECEGDMSPIEQEKMEEATMETERLVKDISLEDEQKESKSKGDPERRQRRRKSSKATGSKTSSREASRRNSNADAQQTGGSRRGSAYSQLPPNIPQRTSSRTISPGRRQTLLTFHNNSKNLFQSLGAALEDPKEAPSAISALLRERASLSSQKEKREKRDRSYSTTSGYTEGGNGDSPLLPTSSLDEDFPDEEEVIRESKPYKPVPATVIDWTHPNTRRREYEKIDRSQSGVRGLWKKVTPHWCQGKGVRTPFYTGDEKDDDTRSVRRYRIEDEDEEEVEGGKEGRGWNCFGLTGKRP